MRCGSLAKPARLLKHILENDMTEVENEVEFLKSQGKLNSLLQFSEENGSSKECFFTPLATVLLYGSEEMIIRVLKSGADIHKQCRYIIHSKVESVSTQMEAAMLVMRFLCPFRDDKRWYLLIPLFNAGLDPMQSVNITTTFPEEEGGNLRYVSTTSILREVWHYTKYSPWLETCLAYCDFRQNFIESDDMLYESILCPKRIPFNKFECIIKHGFHNFWNSPVNVDVFTEKLCESTALGWYTRDDVYVDLFKRMQLLMVMCDYKLSSKENFRFRPTVEMQEDDGLYVNWNENVRIPTRSLPTVMPFMAQLQDIIRKWNSKPKLLAVLCRDKIRRTVHRPHFVANVRELELPRTLEEYLLMPDYRSWRRMGMPELEDD